MEDDVEEEDQDYYLSDRKLLEDLWNVVFTLDGQYFRTIIKQAKDFSPLEQFYFDAKIRDFNLRNKDDNPISRKTWISKMPYSKLTLEEYDLVEEAFTANAGSLFFKMFKDPLDPTLEPYEGTLRTLRLTLGMVTFSLKNIDEFPEDKSFFDASTMK